MKKITRAVVLFIGLSFALPLTLVYAAEYSSVTPATNEISPQEAAVFKKTLDLLQARVNEIKTEVNALQSPAPAPTLTPTESATLEKVLVSLK